MERLSNELAKLQAGLSNSSSSGSGSGSSLTGSLTSGRRSCKVEMRASAGKNTLAAAMGVTGTR
jgi:hypothetical protein